MRLALLLTKLDEIESYCVAQAQAQCTNVNNVDYSVVTITAYSTVITEIRNAVTNYYSSGYGDNRSRQLNMMVMAYYQTTVMESMSIAGEGMDLATMAILNAPRGFTDFQHLFDMGTAGTALLEMPVDVFWEGCNTDGGGNVDVDLLVLHTHLDACTREEATDVTARDALIRWMQLTNMHNSSIFLFEDVSVLDGRPANQKRAIGIDIFTGKHAAEIIRYYGLDIRIPSYIP